LKQGGGAVHPSLLTWIRLASDLLYFFRDPAAFASFAQLVHGNA
jgi:hypothetical protein